MWCEVQRAAAKFCIVVVESASRLQCLHVRADLNTESLPGCIRRQPGLESLVPLEERPEPQPTLVIRARCSASLKREPSLKRLHGGKSKPPGQFQATRAGARSTQHATLSTQHSASNTQQATRTRTGCRAARPPEPGRSPVCAGGRGLMGHRVGMGRHPADLTGPTHRRQPASQPAPPRTPPRKTGRTQVGGYLDGLFKGLLLLDALSQRVGSRIVRSTTAGPVIPEPHRHLGCRVPPLPLPLPRPLSVAAAASLQVGLRVHGGVGVMRYDGTKCRIDSAAAATAGLSWARRWRWRWRGSLGGRGPADRPAARGAGMGRPRPRPRWRGRVPRSARHRARAGRQHR